MKTTPTTGGDPAMTEDKSRSDFEQWYVENAFDYVRDPIGSRECGLQWKAWAASRSSSRDRAEALEEAATVCEAMHPEDGPGDYAYAIRALLNQPQGGGKP